MSTIRANTIANAAGTNSPNIVGGELSRARFSLNGTGTISPFESFNISSFVDNGTGDYTANFATAMNNGRYSFPTTGQDGSILVVACGKIGVAPNANTFRFETRNGSLTSADAGIITSAIFGDRP